MALNLLRTDVEMLEKHFPGAWNFLRQANFRHECMKLAIEMTEDDVCEQSEKYKRFMALIQRVSCQQEWFKDEVEKLTKIKIFALGPNRVIPENLRD